MNFYSNENNVENHFDNINGSSFNYNSFIGDENSSDDYPQQFTFNKYRSEFLSSSSLNNFTALIIKS